MNKDPFSYYKFGITEPVSDHWSGGNFTDHPISGCEADVPKSSKKGRGTGRDEMESTDCHHFVWNEWCDRGNLKSCFIFYVEKRRI